MTIFDEARVDELARKYHAQLDGITLNQVRNLVREISGDVVAELAKPFEPVALMQSIRDLECAAYAKGVAGGGNHGEG